jgi:hypothetical protein
MSFSIRARIMALARTGANDWLHSPTGTGYPLMKARKTLSLVEASPAASNQHELNGVAGLKAVFGKDEFRGPATFVYAGGSIIATANITWYDSREAHPTRSEHRLYFQSNPVMDAAKAGDEVIVTRAPDGSVQVDITPA